MEIFMKLKQSIIAIVISFLVLTPAVAYSTENVSTSKIVTIKERISSDEAFLKEEQESLSKYDSAFLAKQENAYLNYEKLIKSFNIAKSVNSVYPEYYGGSYIDDNGDLVIYVKGEGILKDSSLQNISQVLERKDFIIKNAKYSYNELNSVMDTLNDFKLNNSKDAIANNFNIYWLSDRDNNIVVELNEMNEEQIELFKKQVIDSPIITFEKSSGTPVKEVDVNPGQKISSASNVDGSMGYRAKKDGVVGLVTAGHLAFLNEGIKVDGNNIGRVTAKQESGSVDAAFVEITYSGYTPTNTLNGTSNTLSTTISQPGVGTVINKLGFRTGATSGKVLSTNVTVTLDTILHTNLTSADYSSDRGDSGGIVYSYISATNTRLTLGIHCAKVGSTSYYIKADEINSALGTSRY
ncbi:hypothetical protein HMPREF0322_02622 [Desulfitobacterium hafniense DP7]|nr:hypothetical protein HMPREF0322_02622 [Desulfitobacterium hafniense DP7]